MRSMRFRKGLNNLINELLVIWVHLRSALMSVVLFLFSSGALASQNQRCHIAFLDPSLDRSVETLDHSKKDLVEVFDQIYLEVETLANQLSLMHRVLDKGEVTQFSIQLQHLQSKLDQLIDRVFVPDEATYQEFSLTQKQVIELQDRITKSAKSSDKSADRLDPKADSGRVLEQLIDSPASVQAEQPYRVTLLSGQTLYVIVSNDIVNSYFKAPERQLVVKRSLRRISKGIFPRYYDGEGIIRSTYAPDIVKIRANGHDGNFRLWGYLKGDELHLVHASMNSSHTQQIQAQFTERVSKIRQLREGN